MRIFISGGCKNGKSSYAQKLVEGMGSPRYYLATMIPYDDEDTDRIARHRAEREGMGFITVEQPRDIAALPQYCVKNGVYLLDSLTALLANEMFQGMEVIRGAPEKVCADIASLIEKVKHIVIVSDYIYSDAFEYEELTELYRRGLAMADRAAARACDIVLEASCGTLTVHKGDRLYEKVF